jgi:hypothetical protein
MSRGREQLVRLLWFAALWVGGVGVVMGIALIIRAFLV